MTLRRHARDGKGMAVMLGRSAAAAAAAAVRDAIDVEMLKFDGLRVPVVPACERVASAVIGY